jgi:hypothetical protein
MTRTLRKCVIPAMLIFIVACSLPFSGTSVPSGSTPGASTATAAQPPAPGETAAAATVSFTGSPPGEPPTAVSSWLTDPLSPDKKENAYAIAGDDFTLNRFERPFSAQLAYRPDLDIVKASLAPTQDWFFVSIEVAGVNPDTKTLNACFGVEIDVGLKGRGEFVIWATPPFTADWTRADTLIYGTSTNMVGGPTPLHSDAPWKGATYDTLVVNPADSPLNAVWVRISPADEKVVQIAFTRDILKNPQRFLWGAWADDGIKNPSQFDYNDVYTKKEAGSAFKWDADYPPKSINSVDNTCRAPFGFNPTGAEPGMCEVVPTPGPKPSGPTLTRTLAPPA